MAEKTEEQKAVEAKAATEKAEAEKADADAKADADKAPAAAKPTGEPRGKGHIVTGAAVVLATEDGSERYLYRGATVGGGFSKKSIDHALSVGLIAKAK